MGAPGWCSQSGVHLLVLAQIMRWSPTYSSTLSAESAWAYLSLSCPSLLSNKWIRLFRKNDLKQKSQDPSNLQSIASYEPTALGPVNLRIILEVCFGSNHVEESSAQWLSAQKSQRGTDQKGIWVGAIQSDCVRIGNLGGFYMITFRSINPVVTLLKVSQHMIHGALGF